MHEVTISCVKLHKVPIEIWFWFELSKQPQEKYINIQNVKISGSNKGGVVRPKLTMSIYWEVFSSPELLYICT